MATITNKKNVPLSIPLPGGKKLRLGPLKSAEIQPKAVEQPAVQKLVEAGDVEITGGKKGSQRSGGGAKGAPSPSGGHGHAGGIRKTGDR